MEVGEEVAEGAGDHPADAVAVAAEICCSGAAEKMWDADVDVGGRLAVSRPSSCFAAQRRTRTATAAEETAARPTERPSAGQQSRHYYQRSKELPAAAV